MFTVPGSSSPPSGSTFNTPARKQSANLFAGSHFTTTPAGQPPSAFSLGPSTTPAGPPPSSVFGSPQYSTTFRRDANRSTPSKLRRAAPANNVMDEDHDMDDSLLGGTEDHVMPSVEGLDVGASARALAMKAAALHESDELILQTEHIVENLSAYVGGRPNVDEIDSALAIASQELIKIWDSESNSDRQLQGIGPGERATHVTKAFFLASFLLAFHHPPRKSPPSGAFRTSRFDNQPKPIPEVLIEWLRDYHNQFPNEFDEIVKATPNACAHERFWDVVFSLVLRGDVASASRLLKEADFREAVTALDDGADQPGYRGKQLGNVQRVINRVITVLDACPGVHSGDWNVKGAEWAIFRKRINQALSDLETFAEGSSADRPDGHDKPFEAQNFGLSSVRSDDLSISTMSRRAESKVPWSIYQNLLALYGQLLGTRREIVASSQDWLEASLALTIWWDGEQDDSKVNLNSFRRSFSKSQGPRPVDLYPRTAYQQKLSTSLRQIMSENEEAELQVNTLNPIELGLACIFEDDLEGALGIIRGWSAPISTAIMEVAHNGSWLNTSPAPSQSLMDGFDPSDLMVLSFAQPSERAIRRDEVLKAYSVLLYKRPELRSARLGQRCEGWELAVRVLGRLGNTSVADKRIVELLEDLDITTGNRIEKVMGLCNRLNLPDVARLMSERYADHLAAATHNYGGALYYYARAHNLTRIKDVVNVLISSCIVSSLAYPPSSSLDNTLNSIINSPKQTLAKLATLDRGAAELLSSHISGYAMVRRFYDLRDQEIAASRTGKKPALRPIERKKEAAAVLAAVVMSASDGIHGGLYDADVDSVVQVDILLVLLGEALMFLNQPKRILTTPQLFALMKATEDLSTAPSSVRAQCEECLTSTLAQAQSTATPCSPRALLAASTTSLSASNSNSLFSLINRSEISGLGSSGGGSGSGSGGESGVMVGNMDGGAERAWDWRSGLKVSNGGKEVLQMLRLGLARELSRVWIEGEV